MRSSGRFTGSLDDHLALKRRLEAYWRERGVTVTVKIVTYGFRTETRETLYGLKSDIGRRALVRA